MDASEASVVITLTLTLTLTSVDHHNPGVNRLDRLRVVCIEATIVS
jgi:hypothetical protein